LLLIIIVSITLCGAANEVSAINKAIPESRGDYHYSKSLL